MSYGIPEELASDAGPCYVSAATKCFFKQWGISHRLSSVAFPHSNTRAELGVKSCKRLIRDNTGPKGELYIDKFARALLQYRNTPLQGIELSPAQILFGREIRDFFPFAPGKAGIRQEWRITAEEREKALSKRHTANLESWNRNVKELSDLGVGQQVLVQNQSGNYPQRWGKTGTVIGLGPGPRQYYIRMDGSRRVSLRNRRFLRKNKAVADLLNQIPATGDNITTESEDIGDTPANYTSESQQGIGQFNESLQRESPQTQLTMETGDEQSQEEGQSQEGSSPVGRRYPVRERRMNTKLMDYEVYSLARSKQNRVKP